MVSIKRIVFGALIAALYVAMSVSIADFSYGPIQFRYAEILSVFCLFSSFYIMPLTLGCFLANLIGVLSGINELGIMDALFGPIATLISCILIFKLRNNKIYSLPILALLMPAIINAIIIGLELAIVFGGKDQLLNSFMIFGSQVFLSEFIICTILGILALKPFKIIHNRIML